MIGSDMHTAIDTLLFLVKKKEEELIFLYWMKG